MAFRTTDRGSRLSDAFDRAQDSARRIKETAQMFRAQAVAGSVSLNDLDIGLRETLVLDRQVLVAVAAIPGIEEEAQRQLADPNYDIGPAYVALRDGIDAFLLWMETNFPKDAQGRLLSRRFLLDGSGRVESVALTDANARAALTAQLDALIALID